MNQEHQHKILSSEDIKQLMLNMEREQALLESARKPLLVMLTDLKNSTMIYDRLGDIAAKSLVFKHNSILFPVIEAHGGRVIKTTGDGILATFDSANAGVQAAIQIQQQLMEYNQGREQESIITIRIGEHYGKTIVFENDVYGDSINATARIEALAEGNEILLSETVVQAAQLEEEQLVNIGPVLLKGKLEPVNVYGLVWDAGNSILRNGYLDKRNRFQPGQSPADEAPGITIKGKPSFEEGQATLDRERSNPFLNRSAITQPEYFSGRQVLIHKIFSRLSAQRPQSVSLYGERRIGKSSLINQVCSLKLRRQYLSDLTRFVFITIDIQSMRSASVEHFIETIYAGIRECFGGRISFNLKPDYRDFSKLVEELTKAEISLIIMLDEFDLITLNPNFDVEFYSWLRSLASHYKVAFVTSSLTQLQQLCATRQISDSPFFNIFTAFHVGSFTREETHAMIRDLLRLSLLEYDFEPWLKEIEAQAGYLPFFLQIYCANLFDLYPGNPSPAEVAEAFREEAHDHFEHICRNLSVEELECLQLISAAKKLPPKLESIQQMLLRKGYVIAREGMPCLFSASFDEFLRQRMGPTPSRSLWSKLWKK